MRAELKLVVLSLGRSGDIEERLTRACADRRLPVAARRLARKLQAAASRAAERQLLQVALARDRRVQLLERLFPE